MSLDPMPIARLAAEFMDELEAEYGDDAELLRIAVVVEVAHDDDQSTVELSAHDLTVPDDGEVGPTERAGLMARALAAELAD